MPMLDIIRRLFFHFGENIANDFWRVVRGALRAGSVNGDVGELGPREGVVEVVFHEIIFREVGYICGLDVGEVVGGEDSDVHFERSERVFAEGGFR